MPMPMTERATWWFHFTGWILFTVSATLFTIDSVRNGAVLLTFASLAFLVACLAFLAPMASNRPGRR